MNIDYKNGMVIWDQFTSFDWSKGLDFKTNSALSQDMLTIEFPGCLIDLGWYGGLDEYSGFTIIVVDKSDDQEEQAFNWVNPLASIPCTDKEDVLTQLQRAINIYPKMFP